MLFKQYGNVDAFPICLRTTDTEDIIKIAKNISPVFGALNIEDIETPKVLHIVERLTEELEIPIFHDDQHGTAVVTLAALLNALRLTGRNLSDTSVVVAGAGSAGYGIVRLLNTTGIKDIVVTDSVGMISKSRQPQTMNKYKMELAQITGQDGTGQSLADLVKGKDVFIGVSGVKDLLGYKHVKSMNKNCIVFALTNPDPEIHPKLAMKAGASVVATGSYKYKNRANNALVFPFIMRTILDNRIKKIDLPMLSRVAFALADLVPSKDLSPYNILPDVSDSRIQEAVNISSMSKSL
jgi:malate dehydrogenase (oxaloacetate-decarboxylating)